MTIIPVAKAVFCVSCEAISDGNHKCPQCGSRVLLNLSAILNRSSAQGACATVAPVHFDTN